MPEKKRKKRVDKEHEILKAFIDSKRLEGKWEKEVPIPDKDPKYVRVYSFKRCVGPFKRRMDAVCVTKEKVHWIIEIKLKLNPSCLGQLLCYRRLYADWKSIPDSAIKLGALVLFTDVSLEPVFHEFGIKIFKQSMPRS